MLYSVQFSLVTQLCLTLCDPWTAAHQASLSITNSWSLFKLMSLKLVMPSILCHPLVLNEYSGQISFKMDWLDLLAVQGTLKSLLQHHSSKCCTHNASKFGNISSGHRTEKGQFSFQSQRKTMPRNVQITAQLHSSHMLAK